MSSPPAPPRRRLLVLGALGALALLLVALLGARALRGESPAAPTADGTPPAAGAPAAPSALATPSASADPCPVSDLLVNPCRAWLGVAAGGYPQAEDDQASQLAYAERRLSGPAALNEPSRRTEPSTLTEPTAAAAPGQAFDVVRLYHVPGQVTFSETERSYVERPGTLAFVSWKPDPVWARAAGGTPAVDARIDAFAASVKGLGPHKIFLSLHHEPENDVSKGNCARPAPGAAAGSPADYVAMWHHVRERFDAAGVSNVVWAMNYMGYQPWDCLVPALWPGNDHVDWVTWDPYAPAGDFVASVSRFYDRLEATSDAEHDYASKPWGLAEMGSNTSATVAAGYWDAGRAAVQSDRFPRMKLWSVFDTSVNGGDNGGLRVGYDDQGELAPREQEAFSAFAEAVRTPAAAPASGSG